MTAGAASVAIESEAPIGLANADRLRILTYLSVLIMLMGFGAPFGGLMRWLGEIPVVRDRSMNLVASPAAAPRSGRPVSATWRATPGCRASCPT